MIKQITENRCVLSIDIKFILAQLLAPSTYTKMSSPHQDHSGRYFLFVLKTGAVCDSRNTPAGTGTIRNSVVDPKLFVMVPDPTFPRVLDRDSIGLSKSSGSAPNYLCFLHTNDFYR
jgi:hypothetical protein